MPLGHQAFTFAPASQSHAGPLDHLVASVRAPVIEPIIELDPGECGHDDDVPGR
jgi:hypothetical protein